MRLSRIRFITNFPGKPEMLRYTLFLLAMLPATGAGVAAQEHAYMLVIKDHQFQPT